MVKGAHRHKGHTAPLMLHLSNAPCFLVQGPEAFWWHLHSDQDGTTEHSSLPFIQPRSAPGSEALEIARDTGKSRIQLESVEFRLFDLT